MKEMERFEYLGGVVLSMNVLLEGLVKQRDYIRREIKLSQFRDYSILIVESGRKF